MFRTGLVTKLCCATLMTAGTWASMAQSYPNKPIRMLAAEAGSAGDFAARLVASTLSGNLNHQVIVDNRGVTAAQTATRAPADGYTLLLYGGTIWLLPFLQKDVPYDPVKDLAPISLVVTSPNVLVLHPSVPANSVKELIALARAMPGKLNYGSGLTGSTPHLSAELFKSLASVNLTRISYKGAGPALNALIGNEVQVMFATAGSASPHIKAGRLKALAVASAQPSEVMPGLPTVASSGVAGYESVSPIGLFAPAKTSIEIIDRLNREVVRVLRSSDVKEKLLLAGMEAAGSSPQQFAATVKSDMAVWGKLIKDLGIVAD
jgi:tripartite-type tricarboxylate transporter receptor subunit TctC